MKKPSPCEVLKLPRLAGLPAQKKPPEFNLSGAELPPEVSMGLYFASYLIPAMVAGRNLEWMGPIDQALAAQLTTLMKRLQAWNPSFQDISLSFGREETLNEPVPKRKRSKSVAACFTGGVDSFYTLVTRQHEIDTLVYVLGYDLQRKQAGLWAQVKEMLEKVAELYGKRLIIVETNLRRILDPVRPWGWTHGTALAAVGHLLSHEIGRLIIPATVSERQLHPWGSHPELDNLWSGDAVEIEHDSLIPTRIDKLRVLVEAGVPMKFLRVCWENPESAYNCGHCSKCFRTMTGLVALDALQQVPVFPHRLDYATAGRLDMEGEMDVIFLGEVREALAAKGSAGLNPAQQELASFLSRLPSARRQGTVPFAALRMENAQRRVPLLIKKAIVTVSESETQLLVPIEWGALRTQLEVSFDVGGQSPSTPGDALLLWFIQVAMQHRVPLVLEDAVSPELLASMERAQGVWGRLVAFRSLSRISVTASTAPSLPPTVEKPWAAAFSGGVDAFFTALSESERIGHLLWIEGMESDAIDETDREQMRQWIRQGAAALGKPLIIAKTNLRSVLFRQLGLDWRFMFVMAPYGMGHLLRPHVQGLFIAGDRSYLEMIATSEHVMYSPLLDRFLSSRALTIKLQGMTHTRYEKIVALGLHPALLGNLIVCQQRAERGYSGGRNCGRCEKCLRTIIAFRLAGVPTPQQAFDQPLDLNELSSLAQRDPIAAGEQLFYIDLLEQLKKQGNDPELLKVLEPMVERLRSRSGPVPSSDNSRLHTLKADPQWKSTLAAAVPSAIKTVVSDKPAARLKSLIADPKASGLAPALISSLLQTEGRGRLLRRVMGKVLRFDWKQGGKK